MDWGGKYQRYMALKRVDDAEKKRQQAEAIQYMPDSEREESGNDTAAMRKFNPRQKEHVRQLKKRKAQFGKNPKV